MTLLRLTALGCALALVAPGCDDDDGEIFQSGRSDDGGSSDGEGGDSEAGVCDLSRCPVPEAGIACCTPDAQCGWDPLGLGLNCAHNPGQPLSNAVCDLAQCPLPSVGEACCTPAARCGSDPFASGLVCFANPPTVNNMPLPDGAVPGPEPSCDLSACPQPAVGFPCCLPDGECGTDLTGLGVCAVSDGSAPGGAITGPPNDPSITTDCPSYLGYAGPIWGCCTTYGACGSFAGGQCLLPAGTPVPLPEPDADAGASEDFLRCTPPAE